MPASIIIVDDFLRDPLKTREAALRLSYPPPGPTVAFPGRNSKETLAIPGLTEEVSRLVGEPLTPAPGTEHLHCRITLAKEKGRSGVHMDLGHWSGILYLSLPQHCKGGTEFFKHRQTGTERAPLTEPEWTAAGYDSADAAVQGIVNVDTSKPTKWERTMRVPMRFNRLLLFRPWYWHNAGPAFGETPQNGRLITMLFFASARGQVAR